ncbi:MAG: tubulin-like doman-containing protein [Saprospiraceae bacterium]
MVIGLGGTGCTALRYAKQCFGNVSLFDNDTSAVKFLGFDLDPRSSKGYNMGVDLNLDEFVLLDRLLVEEKLQNIDAAENKSYLEWYPETTKDIITLKEATEGAGQWRPLGRMSYIENQRTIENRINETLNELKSIDHKIYHLDDWIEVCILSSTAGGTGSGLLVDIAYLLQRPKFENLEPIKVETNAFLLLPGIFEQVDVGERIKSNTYGLLKELKAFYSQDISFESYYPQTDKLVKVPRGKVVPFSKIFLFDREKGGTASRFKSPEECYQYIGNVVYLRAVTNLTNDARSTFANQREPADNEKGVDDKVNRYTKKEKIKKEFVFSSCSGSMLQLPERDELRNYLINRFYEEVNKVDINNIKESDKISEEVKTAFDSLWEKYFSDELLKAEWRDIIVKICDNKKAEIIKYINIDSPGSSTLHAKSKNLYTNDLARSLKRALLIDGIDRMIMDKVKNFKRELEQVLIKNDEGINKVRQNEPFFLISEIQRLKEFSRKLSDLEISLSREDIIINLLKDKSIRLISNLFNKHEDYIQIRAINFWKEFHKNLLNKPYTKYLENEIKTTWHSILPMLSSFELDSGLFVTLKQYCVIVFQEEMSMLKHHIDDCIKGLLKVIEGFQNDVTQKTGNTNLHNSHESISIYRIGSKDVLSQFYEGSDLKKIDYKINKAIVDKFMKFNDFSMQGFAINSKNGDSMEHSPVLEDLKTTISNIIHENTKLINPPEVWYENILDKLIASVHLNVFSNAVNNPNATSVVFYSIPDPNKTPWNLIVVKLKNMLRKK